MRPRVTVSPSVRHASEVRLPVRRPYAVLL